MNKKGRRALHVVEEILRRWDPIGVRPGVLAPADEYDSYAGAILALVAGGASVRELAEYLAKIRGEMMELAPDSERDLATAREIIAALGRQADD